MVRREAQVIVDRLPRATGATTQPQLGREALAAITSAQHLAPNSTTSTSTEHVMGGSPPRTRRREALVGTAPPPEALRDAFTAVRGSARVTSPDPEGSYRRSRVLDRPHRPRPRGGKLDR